MYFDLKCVKRSHYVYAMWAALQDRQEEGGWRMKKGGVLGAQDMERDCLCEAKQVGFLFVFAFDAAACQVEN